MSDRYVGGAPQFDDHRGDGAPEPGNLLRRLVITVAIIGVVGIVVLVIWLSSTYRFSWSDNPPPVESAKVPGAVAPEVRWVTASNLNVRADPSADAEVAGELSKGRAVVITSRESEPSLYEGVSEAWTLVRHGLGSGWVSSEYLSAEPPKKFKISEEMSPSKPSAGPSIQSRWDKVYRWLDSELLTAQYYLARSIKRDSGPMLVVVLADDWYYSEPFQKERLIRGVGSLYRVRVVDAGLSEDTLTDQPSVMFVDITGDELAYWSRYHWEVYK